MKNKHYMYIILIHLLVSGILFAKTSANELLIKSVQANNIQGTKDALQKGADPNYSLPNEFYGKPFSAKLDIPLNIAIRNQNLEMIELLIKAGAKVNPFPQENNRVDIDYPMLPLIEAIEVENIPIIKYLIKKGSNINTRIIQEDEWGTALHYAVIKKNIEIVKLLIENGADVNATHILSSQNADGFSDTAITFAQKSHQLEMVKYLVECGATTNERNTIGYMKRSIDPLSEETIDYLELALKMKINVNISLFPSDNYTPLMLIGGQCSGPVQFAFFKEKLLYEEEDKQYPIAFSEEKYFQICMENVKLLVENGADVNARDIENSRPMRSVLGWFTFWYINPKTKKLELMPNEVHIKRELIQEQNFTPKMWTIIKYLMDHGARL